MHWGFCDLQAFPEFFQFWNEVTVVCMDNQIMGKTWDTLETFFFFFLQLAEHREMYFYQNQRVLTMPLSFGNLKNLNRFTTVDTDNPKWSKQWILRSLFMREAVRSRPDVMRFIRITNHILLSSGMICDFNLHCDRAHTRKVLYTAASSGHSNLAYRK